MLLARATASAALIGIVAVIARLALECLGDAAVLDALVVPANRVPSAAGSKVFLRLAGVTRVGAVAGLAMRVLPAVTTEVAFAGAKYAAAAGIALVGGANLVAGASAAEMTFRETFEGTLAAEQLSVLALRISVAILPRFGSAIAGDAVALIARVALAIVSRGARCAQRCFGKRLDGREGVFLQRNEVDGAVIGTE